MTKKLILITGILLSTSLWADDMDYQCSITTTDKYINQITHGQAIKDKCERNNIFRVAFLDDLGLDNAIAMYCRFDRAINTIETNKGWTLSCVLYDNEARVLNIAN